LQLISQSRGDGANWQTAQFKDQAGRTCAYHGTAFTTANRTNVGVPVIDVTNPSNPLRRRISPRRQCSIHGVPQGQ
jgi:hypothetical protein